MIELLMGLGIVYSLFRQLDTLDDVSRLTDKIRALDKATRGTAVKAEANAQA